MKKVTGYLLTATAFIACPCHLIFLLPLALGLLGGTALGATLAANTGWVIAAATVYFVGALAAAIYLLNRPAGDAGEGRTPDSENEVGARARSGSGLPQGSKGGM